MLEDRTLRVDLAKLTTIKVGPEAEVIFPSNISEFLQVLNYLLDNDIRFYIIGNGSNLLLSDFAKEFIFISTKKFIDFEFNENKLYVLSGVSLPFLIVQLNRRGLYGLQNLAGIPASIGGALIMNAGSYGSTTSDYLSFVEVFDKKDRKLKKIYKDDLVFSYRYSSLKEEDFIVLSAQFEFEDGFKYENLKLKTKEILDNKRKVQPLDYPSFGSVFKNPQGYKAWQLIDKVGLRAFQIGDAIFSKKHANFILNLGQATYKDILSLVQLAEQEVLKNYNIKLQREFILL